MPIMHCVRLTDLRTAVCVGRVFKRGFERECSWLEKPLILARVKMVETLVEKIECICLDCQWCGDCRGYWNGVALTRFSI